MNNIDFTDSRKINAIFQEALDKAIAKHKERGESIAIEDKNGKVIIVDQKILIAFNYKNFRNK